MGGLNTNYYSGPIFESIAEMQTGGLPELHSGEMVYVKNIGTFVYNAELLAQTDTAYNSIKTGSFTRTYQTTDYRIEGINVISDRVLTNGIIPRYPCTAGTGWNIPVQNGLAIYDLSVVGYNFILLYGVLESSGNTPPGVAATIPLTTINGLNLLPSIPITLFNLLFNGAAFTGVDASIFGTDGFITTQTLTASVGNLLKFQALWYVPLGISEAPITPPVGGPIFYVDDEGRFYVDDTNQYYTSNT